MLPMNSMKSYRPLRGWIPAALILIAAVANLEGQGNLVLNGDFEAGSQGWTLLRGGFAEAIGSGHGLVVFLGSTNEGPAGEPTASQSLTGLLPGATYLVSGDYEPEKDRGGASPTNASFGVAFDGIYAFEIAATPSYLTPIQTAGGVSRAEAIDCRELFAAPRQ